MSTADADPWPFGLKDKLRARGGGGRAAHSGRARALLVRAGPPERGAAVVGGGVGEGQWRRLGTVYAGEGAGRAGTGRRGTGRRLREGGAALRKGPRFV